MTDLPNWKLITSEEKLATIKAHPDHEKLSVAELATLFAGCSRNAIIGFYHRKFAKTHGLKLAHAPTDVAMNTRMIERRSGHRRAGIGGVALKISQVRKAGGTLDDLLTKATVEVKMQPPVAAPDTVPVPFIDAGNGMCRWPLWDRFDTAETSHICGAKISASAGVYCEFHRGRASQKVPA